MIRLIKIVAVAALAIAARCALAAEPQLCMVGESITADCKGERLAPMAQTFNAVSPDGLNEVRLEVGEKGMRYSVWRRGKAIVERDAQPRVRCAAIRQGKGTPRLLRYALPPARARRRIRREV